jgi:sortase (surface protein transpeptidase)
MTIQVIRQSPPTLAIQQIGNQIQLTWPSSVTNYILESTTSLLPMNWNAITNAPVAADILQTVNLNLSTTNRFFRLRMP